MRQIRDLEYFMSFYGKDGIYPNESLFDVTFEEFENACQTFQEKSGEKWEEFASIEREFARDQLLHQRGKQVVGYVFHPAMKYVGIEHLQS